MRASRGNSSKSPALKDFMERVEDGPRIHAASSDLDDAEPIEELLVDQLRDILHAEKQLLKALAEDGQGRSHRAAAGLIEMHLDETEAQVERLNES